MANESSVAQNSPQAETLPDYKRVLSFWDLFFISTGLIVGSGVMIFTGQAIGMTGRSVSLAYIGAAIWVIFMGIPTILLSSCIRLIGGQYTKATFSSAKDGAASIFPFTFSLSLALRCTHRPLPFTSVN